MPKEEQDESGIIRWMRFLGAKSREEFEKMAKEDSYIDEAYEMLKHMSADEKKRLEYEAREKAIRDYNSQIQSAEEKGEKRGEIADVTGECLEDVLKIQSKEYE